MWRVRTVENSMLVWFIQTVPWSQTNPLMPKMPILSHCVPLTWVCSTGWSAVWVSASQWGLCGSPKSIYLWAEVVRVTFAYLAHPGSSYLRRSVVCSIKHDLSAMQKRQVLLTACALVFMVLEGKRCKQIDFEEALTAVHLGPNERRDVC